MIPKFRAWYDAEMYEEPVIYNGEFYLDWRDFEDGKTYDDSILMQSTGMFDTNGIEIFEGDVILQTFLSPADLLRDSWQIQGIVKMMEGMWLVDTGKEARPLWNELTDELVIGNIYKNPELLEEKDEN